MRNCIFVMFVLLPFLLFAQQKEQVVEKNGKKYILHTVQKGEGALAIAKQYGVTVDEIASANNVNIEKLQRNQVIRIPYKEKSLPTPSIVVKSDTGSVTAAHANAQESKSVQKYNITHVVQRGETLNGIAQQYETTASDIQKWNKLSTTKIEIGQELRIKPFVNNTPYKPWNNPSERSIINANPIVQPQFCEVYMNIEWVDGNQFVLSKKVEGSIIVIEPVYEEGTSKLISNFIYDHTLPENRVRIGTQLAKQLNLQPSVTSSIIVKYIE